MKFSDLHLAAPLLRALQDERYETATPIQAKSIPHVLAGKDLVGIAQTGTGKTASFALPILNKLHHKGDRNSRGKVPSVLVLCPTRELAVQIADGFKAYGRHAPARLVTIFGGVSQYHQVEDLRRGVDVIVATPGRLLDLLNQRLVDLSKIDTLVLDEADRMLDMGFIADIRKIAQRLPGDRQTLMFSATMPAEIRQLASQLLRKPVTVEVTPQATTVEKIDQSVYMVERADKPALLAHLFHELPLTRAIVFTRTKHGADRVVKQLRRFGITGEAIHGNKSQNARQRALNNFKAGRTPLLIATDIASRGIDVDDVSHVINYDLTHEPETYVHRIGRTARAGASGVAVSFCDREERANLRSIEKLIKRPIRVHPGLPTLPNAKIAETHDREEHDDRDERPRGPAHRSDDRHRPAKSKKPFRRAGSNSHPQAARGATPASMTASSPSSRGTHPSHATHASHAPRGTPASRGGPASEAGPASRGPAASRGAPASRGTPAGPNRRPNYSTPAGRGRSTQKRSGHRGGW